MNKEDQFIALVQTTLTTQSMIAMAQLEILEIHQKIVDGLLIELKEDGDDFIPILDSDE